MSYIFTASFKEISESDRQDFLFNDIDDLVEYVDIIREQVDMFEYETDLIKITINDDIEVEHRGDVIKFLSEFDDLNYDVMLAVGDGEFDEYWEEKNTVYYQYQYLIANTGMSAEDAMYKSDEVNIFMGMPRIMLKNLSGIVIILMVC